MNPLPGLNPTHSDLPILCTQAGMKYEELIGAIAESASERAGLSQLIEESGKPGAACGG